MDIAFKIEMKEGNLKKEKKNGKAALRKQIRYESRYGA